MKKIILLLFAFYSVAGIAQNSNELFGKLNYTFIPHNMLNGVGYTFGYQWDKNKVLSYNVEMGMMSAFREREMNLTVGNIQFQNLYYNLAQMNFAFIPTWNFLSTNRLKLSVGPGLTCGYQTKIYTLSHYLYERSTDSWEDVIEVDASSGIHAGALGAIDANYQLNRYWSIGFSAQYHLYYQGESVFVGGIRIGYML